MTIATVPDPRTRVRHLLDQITVTSLTTGKKLDPQAKLGRVSAACRGYQHNLVEIDWGPTSMDEVRTALDALRGAE